MQWLTENGTFDSFMVDISLKAAAILGAAWLIALLLSRFRSSAAARHAVWGLATVSVLGLPFMAAMSPTWHIPTPWENVASRTISALPIEVARTPLLAIQVEPQQATMALAADTVVTNSTAPTSIREIAVMENDPSSRMLPSAMRMPSLGVIWLTGSSVTLAPLFLGLISIWRLARRSWSVTGGPLFVALQEMKEQLGMRCSVRLLDSRTRSMPMTWGIWRPTILLPVQAHRWSKNRLRIVLMHELAHFQRRDCLIQLLSQIARAAYWYNPLAWLAERQIRKLQERACDDLVLNNGFDAADYAQHVLGVSAAYRSPGFAVGFASAMARASQLEARLLLILNPRQNRRPITRRWIRIAAATTFAALCLLSPLSLSTTAVGQQAVQNAAESAQSAAIEGHATERTAALADLRDTITEQYVTAVDEKAIALGAIKGMIEALRDPHSGYFTPEMVAEMEQQIRGSLVGIGAQLEMHDGQIRIVTPLEGSPALKAGVQPGDIILQIDGTPTAGMELTEAVKRIVGPQASSVRLKVGRESGQEVELNIARDTVQVATVKGFQRGPDNRWSFLLDPVRKIGYAQLSQLGSTTPQELRTAVESLQSQGLQGLILDLRFCPGGVLDSAIAVAKLFLSEGTIVSIHSRSNESMPIKVESPDALGDFPLIVLVNGETASAAEIVAGALQDNQRALVMGSRTIGKGSVQSLIKLDGGSGAIRLTTAEYRLPSGRNIDRRAGETSWGIDPDKGYFLPLDQAQAKTLLERRQAREVVGIKSSGNSSPTSSATAEFIEDQQADPQLAAALETMVSRITTGQFAKVDGLSNADIEAFLKREDVERRRVAVLNDLEKLNRELADLDIKASSNK